MKLNAAIWRWGSNKQRSALLLSALNIFFKNCNYTINNSELNIIFSQIKFDEIIGLNASLLGTISGFVDYQIDPIEPHACGGRFLNYVLDGCDGRETKPNRKFELFLEVDSRTRHSLYYGELVHKKA